MGGPGSGNWYRFDARQTTDDFQRLVVHEFHRKGFLKPWFSGSSRWWRGEQPTGSISWGVVGEDGVASALVLSYRIGEETYEYPVPLEWTACHYGGQRPWFRCPGKGCGRRVAVLYGGRCFLCRHCHQLAYASTRERETNRYLRKAQQIRMKLGGTACIYDPFPAKPKGMHWQTYWELRKRAILAELDSHDALMAWLDKMNETIGRFTQ